MLKDLYSVLFSEVKTRFTTKRILVENFLNPLFILFIYGIAMYNFIGNVVVGESQEVPYIAYFLVGSINIAMITNCMVSVTRLFLDKYTGLFNDLLSYPIHRYSIILGRLLFHLIISFVQMLLMLLFTMAIYPDILLLNNSIMLFVFFALLFSSGFYCILFLIAMKINTQDHFNVVYYLVMTPVIYLSSVYYPIKELPYPLYLISKINPLTWSTDVGRYFLLGMKGAYVHLEMGGILLFDAVTMIIAMKLVNSKHMMLK